MFDRCKKRYSFIIVGLLALGLVSCGASDIETENTQKEPETEILQETETEFNIEITDAEEILRKTWNEYELGDRFKIMGGHFESAVVGLPAKYDLSQTTDLVQMYCVPESSLEKIDDAATMIDLYNAGRFTAGVYHLSEVEMIQTMADDMKVQVVENAWHGEKPEKLMVMKVDEQYVVSVYGRETLVDEFKQKLEAVYQTMVTIIVEENIF